MRRGGSAWSSRNEALETHYINHLELLHVSHGEHERALPDPSGRPILIGPGEPPLTASDRDGRDVKESLTEADEDVFRSSRNRLSSASIEDYTDYVELLVPVPDEEEDITLAIRLRNTLLNSVLFYDVILADSGVGALEWLGSKMNRIGGALEMGRWYQKRMGMRVLVERSGDWHEVEHLADVGPISWTEVAVPIRVSEGTTEARVRLEFVSDSWFIDRVEVAGSSQRPPVNSVQPSRVVRADGSLDDEARTQLLAPDNEYFTTLPGQRFEIEFERPPLLRGEHTLLLGAQGYYVEWVRGKWLEDPVSHEPFEPSDGELLRALRRWDDVREDFERDFHAIRIPVR